jgi:hypothetical protein
MGSQQRASRRNIYQGGSLASKPHERNPRYRVVRKSGLTATFPPAQRRIRAAELDLLLERLGAGKIGEYGLGEHSRIAARRADGAWPLPPSPGEQRTSSVLDRVITTFEARKPEYLHMACTGDGADIGEEVVLLGGRNQGRQEDNVGNALVDRGESVVERLGDNDIF